jgi:hypothetical protein
MSGTSKCWPSNRIGKRGENIFATIISRNVASRGFLFDPTFLGDKFPTVDFHVDLLQYPYKAFFYASVIGIDETQEKGYLISANNLNTSLNISGIPTKFPVSSTVL